MKRNTHKLFRFASRSLVKSLAATSLILASFIPAAKGSIIVTFTETGSGVDLDVTGSLSTLSGLTFFGNINWYPFSSFGWENTVSGERNGVISAGATGDQYGLQYNGGQFTSFSQPFPATGNFELLASDPGIELSIWEYNTDTVTLPDGYTAGQVLNISVANPGKTLADFGLSDGDAWGATWATNTEATATESILFSASSAVPEASEALVVLLGMTGLLGARRRSR